MSSNFKSGAHRALQIHVTRKCNLKCLHCYSSSGPDETAALSAADLKEAILDAKTLGYTFVTLSGGEPFLYGDMVEVLTYAKSLDLMTGLVTNGMFLDKRRLDVLVGVLDLAVVSLDGAPERHNRMRANPAAFEVMAKKLPNLRESGIPFGFLYTLSRDNIDELDWAADFAADAGASMLQVHPLDNAVGRAGESGALEGLDPDEMSAVFAGKRASQAQKRVGDRLRIVVDYRPRAVREQSCSGSSGAMSSFADLVPSLCIETDGAFVPMGHGFSRDYMLGTLGETRLVDLAEAWVKSGPAMQYLDLVQRVQRDADGDNAPVLQNMAQVLNRASHGQRLIAAE